MEREKWSEAEEKETEGKGTDGEREEMRESGRGMKRKGIGRLLPHVSCSHAPDPNLTLTLTLTLILTLTLLLKSTQ